MFNKYLLIVICVLGTSCFKEPSKTLTKKERLLAQMNNHITRTMPFWKKYFQDNFHERVHIAPKEVIEYINLDNQKNGFPNKPLAPTLSDGFLKDVKLALNELPVEVKKLLNKKFAGVFLVNDLGGTGYTDYIIGDNNEPIAAFVVLDAEVLNKRSANQWATWKESTPFKKGSSFEVEAVIAKEGYNNRKNAIQYILLHEFGHVVSVGEHFHPKWGISPKDLKNIERYAFFNESWTIDNKKNRFISRFDSTLLPERERVVYYFGPKLKGEQVLQTYTNLEKTDFVTLYASTHPGDDWAESFVTYIHTQLMKKPFSIKIKNGGKVVKVFDICWGKSRCAKKQKLLTELFEK